MNILKQRKGREAAMKKMMLALWLVAMVAVAFALNAGKTGCGPLELGVLIQT